MQLPNYLTEVPPSHPHCRKVTSNIFWIKTIIKLASIFSTPNCRDEIFYTIWEVGDEADWRVHLAAREAAEPGCQRGKERSSHHILCAPANCVLACQDAVTCHIGKCGKNKRDTKQECLMRIKVTGTPKHRVMVSSRIYLTSDRPNRPRHGPATGQGPKPIRSDREKEDSTATKS